MAADMPRLWPLLSFFAVGLAQQPMLVGITLPLYSVHFAAAASTSLGAWDALATLACVGGLLLASRADDQLREYVLVNHKLAAQGKPPVPVRTAKKKGPCRRLVATPPSPQSALSTELSTRSSRLKSSGLKHTPSPPVAGAVHGIMAVVAAPQLRG
jgi:hypothetical protein